MEDSIGPVLYSKSQSAFKEAWPVKFVEAVTSIPVREAIKSTVSLPSTLFAKEHPYKNKSASAETWLFHEFNSFLTIFRSSFQKLSEPMISSACLA